MECLFYLFPFVFHIQNNIDRLLNALVDIHFFFGIGRLFWWVNRNDLSILCQIRVEIGISEKLAAFPKQ